MILMYKYDPDFQIILMSRDGQSWKPSGDFDFQLFLYDEHRVVAFDLIDVSGLVICWINNGQPYLGKTAFDAFLKAFEAATGLPYPMEGVL